MAEGKIRIKDIAKIAGVSATTVSNVIHGRTEKVSRKTRKRIEEILDEQEYAPSMGARILSGKSSGMIAVVVGKRQEWEQESEKLEKILREIEKSLDEREYYMLLHFVLHVFYYKHYNDCRVKRKSNKTKFFNTE